MRTVSGGVGFVALATLALGCSGTSSGDADAGGDTPSAADADAAPDTDVVRDAAAVCDPKALFGAPVPLESLNTAAKEGGPRLTADELTMYFSRADTGSQSRLFVAHRSNATAPFDPASPLTTLDSAFDEYDPTTTTNELTIFFTSVDRPDVGAGDLWMATRATTAEPFGPPGALAAPLNSGSSDLQPFLRAGDAELWFASNRPGGAAGVGNYDLYRAARAGASFAPPAPIVELSAPGSSQFAPTISADGLIVFFTSTRSGGSAPGDEDIWSASRAKVSDPFSNVQNVSAVNSTRADFPGWLSGDGCRLYLSSLRSGNEDIYVATRSRP
jgi:hypothetical protein